VDYPFKIHLRGIIDLLSHHLYSGPQVFLRELLQNGVDAIRARQQLEPGHAGEIAVEVIEPRGRGRPALAFVDDGIGLTDEEIHRFLSTIGESSKRGDGAGAGAAWERPVDFLGQFGIGLLSCFIVCDEIVVLTRSARRPEAPTIEWRGRPDGTYSVKTLDQSIAPGTQVYLTCKTGHEEFFTPEHVRESAARYGGLLPCPVRVAAGGDTRTVNEEGAPWRRRFESERERTEGLLEYGRNLFGIDFFDAVPLRSESCRLDGVAFVLPFAPSPAARQSHRVYLKDMLVSENAEGLLPDWAFFVRCVVNTEALRPTASRDAFVDDEALGDAREALGEQLRAYLLGLSSGDPRRLRRLIALHSLTIKALALHDDEFYRLFVDWLDFETSHGTMTLGEYRRRNDVVRFVPDLDRFRQIARVALAQGVCVINAAYTYDAELLARLPSVIEGARIELVEPSVLAQGFEDPTLDERDEAFELVRLADEVLAPYQCAVELKKFFPEGLPALYSTDPDAGLYRSLDEAKEVSNPLWSSVLEHLAGPSAGPHARLFLNYLNPMIRRMARVRDPALLRRTVEMLYIQSLLLGHQPLNTRELTLLNEGLIGLIEWGLAAQGGGHD
jgi:molecular chaperone HtpG